jgi:hypothetical protein
MRKISKTVSVTTIKRTLYDKVEKQEKEETISVIKGKEKPPLPENCVLLSEQELETAERTYEMSTVTFFKYATIVQK